MLNLRRKLPEIRMIKDKKRELECEEAIISEKSRFGRVRKAFMECMREQYGGDIANRTLWRINRRKSEGYLGFK